jgi:hypothetical protein
MLGAASMNQAVSLIVVDNTLLDNARIQAAIMASLERSAVRPVAIGTGQFSRHSSSWAIGTNANTFKGGFRIWKGQLTEQSPC